jgi:thiol-disulfide isomerase/thioredoxin
MNPRILFLLLATGCGTARQVKALELQVSSLTTTVFVLEGQIQTLESKVSELETLRSAPQPDSVDPIREEAASQQYHRVESRLHEGKPAETAEAARQFAASYADTQVYKRNRKTLEEMMVLGTRVPQTWANNIEKTFQGEGQIDLIKGTTIVVFWESWCPHCQRELPKLSETYTRFNDQGLKVVGLTRITKSATEATVTTFIHERAIPFPIAKENGVLADYFHVQGIPAVVVVKEGIVVWRGHPARLTDTQITSFLRN